MTKGVIISKVVVLNYFDSSQVLPVSCNMMDQVFLSNMAFPMSLISSPVSSLNTSICVLLT